MAGARGIYGLSGSGIDVESLVKVGMMSEQKKYDRLYKKEVETEWRKEAFADVYSAVNTFRSSMSDMRLSSRTKPMTATSSLSDVVTATANANAGVMSHTVEVTQAASNAYLMTASGQKVARTNTAAPASVALKDVAFAGGTMPAGMASGDTALSFKLSNGTGTAEVKFTAEEIFTKNLTLNDLATRINNARFIDSDGKKSALNITASYDAVSDAFSIVNTKSGSDNKVSLSVDTGAGSAADTTALLNNLKLGQVSGGSISAPLSFTAAGTTSTLEAAGTNASVKIDGRTYTDLQDNKLQGQIRCMSIQHQSHYNVITGNELTDSLSSSIHLAYGSSFNTVSYNRIRNNRARGEGLLQAYVGASKNDFYMNEVEVGSEGLPKYMIYCAVVANENSFWGNRLSGPAGRAYIAVESAFNSKLRRKSHRGYGLRGADDHFTDRGMYGVRIVGNEIRATSMNVPVYVLAQVGDDRGQYPLLMCELSGNQVQWTGRGPLLELSESQAGLLRQIKLVGNEFAPVPRRDQLVLPRGGKHFSEMVDRAIVPQIEGI